jgi:hypothetical protein
MTDARRRNSHIPLNTRRQRLRDRWSLITLLVALNLIPPHTAANGLGSYLIRNPHRRSGTCGAGFYFFVKLPQTTYLQSTLVASRSARSISVLSMLSPIVVARTSLCGLLLPHTAGDQVDLHDPLHEAATAYFEKDPCGFCEDFILPTFQEVESLARKLGCGGVVTPTGCVASETDTLLCILLRLRSEMSWKSMAKHPEHLDRGGPCLK